MPVLHLPSRARHPFDRAHTALVLVLGLLMLGVPSLAVALPSGGGASSGPPVPSSHPLPPAGDQTAQVTLLTGDVVAWHRTADGRQSAWVVDEGQGQARRPAAVYEQDGEVHVVPAEAAPYVHSGVVDPDLFNITRLVEQGFDDRSTDQLPLLLQGGGRPATRSAPDVPAQARTVRELDSIGMRAVTVPKSKVRATWTSLRGSSPAPLTASEASLATAGRIWLNGRARVSLEDSVPQVSAPEAWEAGYDGSGATVAVLDTGYDPAHPDLQGQVVGARDFTGEEATEPAVDLHGHGTHVASIVAGTGAASDGSRRGVAPGADLLIGKVLDATGSGSLDQIIAGMEWAAESGADVVNLSLSSGVTDGTDPLSQAVDRLTRQTGTLFVAAAGNWGPSEGTVMAPGAADTALTVGAVTKEDTPAAFSSRGPRWGDAAVKPEIVAPGAGIVAARAAGTSVGQLVDRHYTGMSGTSMAAPHVAGAAALLAQQHPDWEADDLKDQLVASSTLLPGAPVTFQGAGRLDVAQAVGQELTVEDPVLSLGTLASDAPLLTRTVTFRNDTDEGVSLRLTPDVVSTGSDPRQRPDLEISKRTLSVPAGEEADVLVRIDPAATEPGDYAGRIVAEQTGAGDDELVSVVAFSVARPGHTLTVEALDRSGRGAGGFVDVWSNDTGQERRLWFADGIATAELPEGSYTVAPVIHEHGKEFFSREQTVTADPDVELDEDVRLEYDARDAAPVRIEVPRPTDPLEQAVTWRRQVHGRWIAVAATYARDGQDLFLLPSPGARVGSFRFAHQRQLVQPLLTARTIGGAAYELLPRPKLASLFEPFVGRRDVPVVDGGTGTPPELDGVDGRGKALLLTRTDEDLAVVVERARATGAEVVLVGNHHDDLWLDELFEAGVPVYKLTREVAERLRSELAEDPGLRLDLNGIRDHTYAYELVFAGDRVPRTPVYQVSHDELATVRSDYRSPSSRQVGHESWVPVIEGVGFGNGMLITRNGPVVREEYVTATPGIEWRRFGQPSTSARSYWTWSGPVQYTPGERAGQTWWGPLVHPSVVTEYAAPEYGAPVGRFRDTIRVAMPHYTYGGSLHSDIDTNLDDSSLLTLSRDGEPVGSVPWSVGQFTVPGEEAEYELRLQVRNGPGNFAETSTATDTTWRFRSGRVPDQVVLPLVEVDYGLETDSHDAVPAHVRVPLVIRPRYQPGADGPGGFTVRAEVSYDDGASWSDAPVSESGDAWTATLPEAPGPGFGTLRVIVTDGAGNRLDQRIDRGWRVRD